MDSTVRLDLERLLSPSRFSTYLNEMGGVEPAFDLYEWNTRLSAAFFESIQGLEVALRNVMSDRLERHHHAAGSPQYWYDDPSDLFNPRSKAAIATARHRLSEAGRDETPGRVVSELSFGFWRYLLTGKYQTKLWVPTLQHGFRKTKRKSLERNVEQVHLLRNRIAHHEPIFARDLVSDYRALLQASESISLRLAWWIDRTSRVPSLFRERP